MTLHIMVGYVCRQCDNPYMPFHAGVLCPVCGNCSGDTVDFIGEVIPSLDYNLRAYGKFRPTAWLHMCEGDQIAYQLFNIFEVWRKGKSTLEQSAIDYLETAEDWGDREYMKKHIQEMVLAISETSWFADLPENIRDPVIPA